jgi:hypothetical protein
MPSGAPSLRMSVRRGQLRLLWCSSGLSSVLLSPPAFSVLRWTIPGTILGEVASRRGFT